MNLNSIPNRTTYILKKYPYKKNSFIWDFEAISFTQNNLKILLHLLI